MAIPVHNRKIAIALTFAGAFAGTSPLPLAWLHKFYLGQYLWGVTYLVLAGTGLPQMACCFECLWYLTQSDDSFTARFPNAGSLLQAIESGPATVDVVATQVTASHTAADSLRSRLASWLKGKSTPDSATSAASAEQTAGQKTSQLAIALRELDQLRKEGLMTEYEFEQKRRKLLEQV